MVWVKLDDKFHSNEKILEAGHAAAGLYAMALSYCGDHLTDGRVPDAWANQQPKLLRDKLVKHGLWKKTRGGYVIADFNELNPTKADVEAKRAKQREGGLKGAANRWKDSPQSAAPKGQPISTPMGEPKRPDPTRKIEDQDLSLTGQIKSPQTVAPAPASTKLQCPRCTVNVKNERELREHLDNVHWLEGEAADAAINEGAIT